MRYQTGSCDYVWCFVVPGFSFGSAIAIQWQGDHALFVARWVCFRAAIAIFSWCENGVNAARCPPEGGKTILFSCCNPLVSTSARLLIFYFITFSRPIHGEVFLTKPCGQISGATASRAIMGNSRRRQAESLRAKHVMNINTHRFR